MERKTEKRLMIHATTITTEKETIDNKKMKTKNLIIFVLCVCLLIALTNCKKKQLVNETDKSTELAEKKSDSTNTEIIFSEAEVSPSFPGGEIKMLEFINKNINKKIVGNLNFKEGKVVARFQIDTIGKVVNLRIVRSYNQVVDSEFIRVLKIMPNWKSGKQLMNGTNGPWVKTAVYMTFPLKIPYKYELNDTTKPSY